jgi:N6-adenosine-specific RNA methylase IME4
VIPHHPLADLFPLIEGREFDAFAADVRANGLREKILIREGKILDGRNRYRALVAAGLVGPRLTAAQALEKHRGWFACCDSLGAAQAVARVVSLNLARRHLSESQRALIAARLATMGRGRPGKSANWRGGEMPTIAPPPGPPPGEPGSGHPPHSGGGIDAGAAVSAADASRLLNVGERSVQRARALVEAAPAAVVAEVAAGKTRVSSALAATRAAAAEAGVGASEAEIERIYARLKDRRERERLDKIEAKKRARAEKERALGQRIAQSAAALAGATKRYGVILADPEWAFETWGEAGKDRAAENHYPTSPTDAIARRPVESIAADDAVLFLWATAPMLRDALVVMSAWGFRYVSHCVWLKPAPGTGYWFRSQHEILLVGVRGNIPAPAPGTQWRSALAAPAGAHSEKPAFAHEMIEALFPTLPKIELNARQARDGWDVWGAESPSPVEAGQAKRRPGPEAMESAKTPSPDEAGQGKPEEQEA